MKAVPKSSKRRSNFRRFGGAVREPGLIGEGGGCLSLAVRGPPGHSREPWRRFGGSGRDCLTGGGD